MADERHHGAMSRPTAWHYPGRAREEEGFAIHSGISQGPMMQAGWEQQPPQYHWGEQQDMSQSWMEGHQPSSGMMAAALAALQQLMPHQGAMQQVQAHHAAMQLAQGEALTMSAPPGRSQQPQPPDVPASTMAAAQLALAQLESAEEEFAEQQKQMAQHYQATQMAQMKLQDAKKCLSAMQAAMHAASFYHGNGIEPPAAAFAGAVPPHLSSRDCQLAASSAEQESQVASAARAMEGALSSN